MAKSNKLTPEMIAEWFHETYERLAPDHGYTPREETSVPWEDVPEPNKSLMIAVASEVLGRIAGHEWSVHLQVHAGPSWAMVIDDEDDVSGAVFSSGYPPVRLFKGGV